MANLSKLPYELENLTPIQVKLLDDWTHRFIVNPAGRRSRKTLIGKRKIFYHAMLHDGYHYFHGAPTYQQAKEIFWDDLKRYTAAVRVDKSESELWVKLCNGSKIKVVGLDKPERIEGQLWHGCHITEMGKIKQGAWEENIRPTLSDTKGFAILDGVPEGINHYFDLALYSAGGALPETFPKVGSFAENPADPEWAYYHWFSIDVLDEKEIESARMHMDERTFRQEYLGSFESYEGLAYYNFSSDNLKDCQYVPEVKEGHRKQKNTIHIGMDFNVNPMTATFNHIYSNDIHQFGEAYLINSNTFEMRDHIKEKFPVEQCILYPDSTGRAMESNASESDLAILKKAGFQVKARPSNPFVKDRVASVTSKIRSDDGKCHYFINQKTCPKTIEDMNKVVRTNDGRLDKKQEEQGLKHITDAQGYLIHFLFPVKDRRFGGIDRFDN